MSEWMNMQTCRTFRRDLLASVSVLSLTVTLAGSADASDKPPIWIELGGQFEMINGLEDPFLPPFTQSSPTPGPYSPISPAAAQKPSIFSYGAEGRITFRPEDTGWIFSGAIRYGRSNNNKHIHQQTKVYTRYPNTKYPRVPSQPPIRTQTAAKFADFKIQNRESHAVIDFQAGHDVGLGMISSVASLGIRMADFTSKAHASIIARPDVAFHDVFYIGKYRPAAFHTDYMAQSDNERSFRGIGPSISWEGNVPVFGGRDGAVTFDWGVNAAALFGRQKADGAHQTTARHYVDRQDAGSPYVTAAPIVYQHPPLAHDRSRSVMVPNFGGLAGISFRYSAAKVSFGYRADLFLGAMDMGIDTRHTVDRNFYGPFATVSVGIGG